MRAHANRWRVLSVGASRVICQRCVFACSFCYIESLCVKQRGCKQRIHFNTMELEVFVKREVCKQRNKRNYRWKCHYVGRTKKNFIIKMKKKKKEVGALGAEFSDQAASQLGDGQGRWTQYGKLQNNHIFQTSHKKWLWIILMSHCDPTVCNTKTATICCAKQHWPFKCTKWHTERSIAVILRFSR